MASVSERQQRRADYLVALYDLTGDNRLFGNERGVGTAQNQRESAVGVHSARLEHAISW
jgi:hypothetical protein